MSSNKGSLRRAKPSRFPRKRFLIVCEGSKSEPNYIGGVKALSSSPLISVELIGGAGQTKKVVEEAVKLKREAERSARKSKDPYDKYDKVWCVLDVDEHPYLDQALIQARDNNVSVALSNPCYELWVILHLQDHRRSITRHALQSECRSQFSVNDKHIAFERLWPSYVEARRRAQELRAWQAQSGREKENPWTNFDELVEDLLSLIRD